MVEIIPAILTEDKEDLKRKMMLMNGQVKIIHIDVMDGKFVESRSLNLQEMRDIINSLDFNLEIELHLMIENPQKNINVVKGIKNIKSVVLHKDSTNEIRLACEEFKREKIRVGLSVRLNESLKVDEIPFDYFLVLAEAEPGFSGTPFEMDALTQIDQIRARYGNMLIEVDGGINEINGKHCLEHGANKLVANSYIFKSNDPLKALEELKTIV